MRSTMRSTFRAIREYYRLDDISKLYALDYAFDKLICKCMYTENCSEETTWLLDKLKTCLERNLDFCSKAIQYIDTNGEINQAALDYERS